MGWEESISKILSKISEKMTRVVHPKTKTLSDLIVEQYRHKNLVVEKNYAKLSRADRLNEPKEFIDAIEKL